MRRIWIFGIVLLGVAYGLTSSGLIVYFRSIARPIVRSPNESLHEDLRLTPKRSQGTVLLLHGMNFDASKLKSLGGLFQQLGYTVFIPRLAGHRANLSETQSDPTGTWRDQIQNWQSHVLKRPLICAGYSLGGLLVTAEHVRGALDCDRFILFAPALATKTSLSTAKLVERIWPSQWTIPSGIPDAYKHFTYLGLAPSFALVHILEDLQNRLRTSKDALPPGLVFVDPRDEVIDAKGLKTLIDQRLSSWSLHEIEAKDLPETHAFHLIVDEPHLGAQQWQGVRDSIQKFLDQPLASVDKRSSQRGALGHL